MTQARLAEKVGVTKATISGWENGYYRPGPDMAKRLALTLSISLEQIYAQERRAA